MSNAKNCDELLAQWDAGESVWTVEMGGISPGYEQAIQITAFEILRYLVTERPDTAVWRDDKRAWIDAQQKIDAAVLPLVDGLGLSGAQWGAALSLATKLYMDGPQAVDTAPDDRKMLASKNFPVPAEA